MQEEGSQTNFQRASLTLAAGVVIYSQRVDSVHNDAFKVLGGLSRSVARGASEDDGAGPLLFLWCNPIPQVPTGTRSIPAALLYCTILELLRRGVLSRVYHVRSSYCSSQCSCCCCLLGTCIVGMHLTAVFATTRTSYDSISVVLSLVSRDLSSLLHFLHAPCIL